MAQREIQRPVEARTHVEQLRRTSHHQLVGFVSLFRRNLPPPAAVRQQVGEFGQRKVRRDERDLAGCIAIEETQSGPAIGFGKQPPRGHAAIENESLQHRLSLAIPSNERRTVVKRWQRSGKSF